MKLSELKKSHVLKKVVLTIVFVVVVAFFIAYSGIGGSEEALKPSDVVLVDVYDVDDALGFETIRVGGTTKSAETAQLRFQVSGRVIEKKVRLGDSVIKGQVLVVLDNPEIAPLERRATQNLAQLEVQVMQAKRDFDRINGLYEEQAITKQEWEQVNTQYKSTRTLVEAARAELQRASRLADELALTAPFDGVVTDIHIDEGEVIQVGAPALRLSNPDSVELQLALSDSVIGKLSKSQAVRVYRSLGDSSDVIVGVIVDISPYREQGALPKVVIVLPEAQIRPGVAVTAELDVQSDLGLRIPINAVVMTGEDSAGVYYVSDLNVSSNNATSSKVKSSQNGQKIVKLIPVTPLKIGDSTVLIDSQLKPGDQVVTAGVAQLYDGARIRIRPSKSPSGLSSQAEPELGVNKSVPANTILDGASNE